MVDRPLEEIAGEYLKARGLRLAVAESCTGGLIGHRLTNVPGSSAYFQGGITAYSYEAKHRLLGVSWDLLSQRGAVNRETVLQMARAARQALGAEIAVSVSGIAGPDGGSAEKPVGLTWIGLSAPDFEDAWRYIWPGNRLQVKEQSAEEALRRLAEYLESVV